MKNLKKFFIEIWDRLKDRTNIIIFACVLVVVYSPTWLVGALGLVFGNAVMIGIATAYAAFWAGPFTPFFPIVISLTFAIRKIADKISDNRKRKNETKKRRV